MGQEGYETRHVVYSLFKATVRGVSVQGVTPQEIAKNAIMRMSIDALPMSEVRDGLCRVAARQCACGEGGNVDARRLWHGDDADGGVYAQVPATAHSFLTRGVYSGGLIMTAVFMQELRVPVVPIGDLRNFLSSDEVCI